MELMVIGIYVDLPRLLSWWLQMGWAIMMHMHCHFILSFIIVTLTLGLRPRQRLAMVWTTNEDQESHFMLPRVQEGVRE
jgi:hypothetical protein